MSTKAEVHFTENQLLDPKSPVGVYEFPCGYLDSNDVLHTDFEIKEIEGHEEDILASAQIPDFKKTDMLIGNCFTRVGTYTDRPSLSRIPEELAVGDQVYAMLAIRRVTVGDEFPMEETCPAGHKDFYVLDLSELEIRKMAEPKRRIFDLKLPSGKTVRWHVMNGKDQKRTSQLLHKFENDKISIGISARLELINDKPVDLATVKGLSMRDRNFLRETFDETEGGVDTTLKLFCKRCRSDFESELDISKQGFFSPSAALKVLKKKYSI